MYTYTDKGLATIRENTARLYAKLASLKPTDGFTLEDIQNTMYYLQSFADEAKREQHKRVEAYARRHGRRFEQ